VTQSRHQYVTCFRSGRGNTRHRRRKEECSKQVVAGLSKVEICDLRIVKGVKNTALYHTHDFDTVHLLLFDDWNVAYFLSRALTREANYV
jgi:hypothetical protein